MRVATTLLHKLCNQHHLFPVKDLRMEYETNKLRHQEEAGKQFNPWCSQLLISKLPLVWNSVNFPLMPSNGRRQSVIHRASQERRPRTEIPMNEYQGGKRRLTMREREGGGLEAWNAIMICEKQHANHCDKRQHNSTIIANYSRNITIEILIFHWKNITWHCCCSLVVLWSLVPRSPWPLIRWAIAKNRIQEEHQQWVWISSEAHLRKEYGYGMICDQNVEILGTTDGVCTLRIPVNAML